jgi:hypothetical protein
MINKFIFKILAIFTLIEGCYVNNEKPAVDSSIFTKTGNRNPIANYCLVMGKYGYGSLKFESIIDSSNFAKMKDRNIWQCDSECETQKKYFAKIENRDSMYCFKQSINKKYNFLFENIAIQTHFGVGRGPSIASSIVDCFDVSSGKAKFVPCHSSSSGSFERNSSSSSSYHYTRHEALTEIIIDISEETDEIIRDSSKLNEIKSSFGDTIPVSWEFKINCPPHNDTTITGSYFIRITGECK